ncbi:MAG TPA: VPDSG-CTERM sorting domain-containing protein [Chthoniobacterales bacterium]
MSTSISRLFSAAVFLALPYVAFAADIDWGSVQDITGSSDVLTSGNLVGAFNVGDTGVSSTEVNTVNFQGFAVPGGSGMSGNFSASGSFAFPDNTAFGSTNAPFTGLDPAYQTLLMSGVGTIADFTLAISGLTVGAQYQFQFFVNNSSDTNNFGTSATGGMNTSDRLGDNPSFVDGGLGQYMIGSFTADSSMQTIVFTPDEVGVLNAFQLRLSPVGVPDGGQTLSLLALALGSLVLFRRQISRLRVA